MKATLLLKERHVLDEHSFAELIVWRVPTSVDGSRHDLKYRLAYIVDGRCVLRYDNERGKGDHRHDGLHEVLYEFNGPEALITDFWRDIARRRP